VGDAPSEVLGMTLSLATNGLQLASNVFVPIKTDSSELGFSEALIKPGSSRDVAFSLSKTFVIYIKDQAIIGTINAESNSKIDVSFRTLSHTDDSISGVVNNSLLSTYVIDDTPRSIPSKGFADRSTTSKSAGNRDISPEKAIRLALILFLCIASLNILFI
jgi:hypothetical protein